MTDNKALEHLNRCLKTARMGTWESSFRIGSSDPLEAEITWNSQVRAMHAMPEDYQGSILEWFKKHVHPEDFPKLVEASQNIFLPQDGENNQITFAYRFIWPNGEVRHIEMNGSFDFNPADPTLVKVYGISRDITQDVQHTKLIEDQKNRLLSASRMAVLGEISGGIAHEINNPLTVIQARSFQLQQMCDLGNLDSAKIKSAAESISKTADKIAKIVKSLRAFAQGQVNEPLDKISVQELIKETLDFRKVRFYNHGIDVRLGEIPENLEFECHLIQIEEALLSLFNNAHDAAVEQTEKWISINVHDMEKDIEIHITDSGRGIPEEIADKMMLPFFTTKVIGKGMGLGLCIAAEIISKHHGSLTYDRTCPHTRFVIRMPKTQPKAAY